ncbi:S-layer homology domain-containing protein [Selenomonas sp. WCT3]|uniref:S-layer homology domain-containing protein n=1 Tax=Selenomonas sp. WCT3 TaxID=3158785 RepID=UPI000888B43A|nr:S-layer homology domain-containing protein [Selenomonas ruminantium]
MKKAALMAAVLAATTMSTTAFAAQNPFKDLPEGHWAYDAVTMLAEDGVLEGYSDGTFRGTKTMNRYEMAQIVAKAMEKYDNVQPKDKGAINKLKKEFSAELKDMDVRLSNVEQEINNIKSKQSNIKMFGDVRFRYAQNIKGNYYKKLNVAGMDADMKKHLDKKEKVAPTRFRLGMWGEPAPNLSFNARLKLEHETNRSDADKDHGLGSDNHGNVTLDRAEVNWSAKNGFRIDAGRMEKNLGQGLIWWENGIDGFAVNKTFGPKMDAMFGWGDITAENWGQGKDKWMPGFFANVSVRSSSATTITVSHLNAKMDAQLWNPSVNDWGWINFYGKAVDYKLNQTAVGFNTKLSPRVTWLAEGIVNNVAMTGKDQNKHGFWTRVVYGNLDWMKKNTWHTYVEYAALGNYAVDSSGWGHHMDFAGGNGYGGDAGGCRGYGIGFSYMLAPQANVELNWHRMKTYNTKYGTYDNMLLSGLIFSF